MMMIRTDRLPNAITRGQKRYFAIRSRLVTASGKTIRHIVIFDNHPDSLRLLLSSGPTVQRRNKSLYVVLTTVLVLAAGLGMLWPLL